MKTLELDQMEEIQGGASWSCFSGLLGLLALGMSMSAAIPVAGTLAWGAMMVSAFAVGGSLGHCGYSLSNYQ